MYDTGIMTNLSFLLDTAAALIGYAVLSCWRILYRTGSRFRFGKALKDKKEFSLNPLAEPQSSEIIPAPPPSNYFALSPF